ncbi:hypothetical protein CL1_0218 [Thermococcus cleftensis]|uniref:Uncharacterized protein n=1 Tax=Thermococcus cleftensis (strain DSM 27260 / KACC 17922 / CL1) TaxID=163003 RepID=I3ZRU6_THECF|nr:hypothetical protein [Thermococcus cleftensis]AFL94430.1 hypothetical protein CL1_0218 [Thermococcus cleftensis]
MRENVSPPRLKWGISLIMTLVYAFGATWFYYLPSRGEPELDVTFWGLLARFLVLSFLFWIILIPERRSSRAPDMLMLTVLTVPAGVLASLLFIFAVTSFGIHETYGAGYFVLALVPFLIAHKTVKSRISWIPFALALVYGLVAYIWGNMPW